MAMQGSPEAESYGILVERVVLPNGQVKHDVALNPENTVREEKENILRDAQIPYPVLYMMVVIGPHNASTVMDENRPVEFYIDSLTGGIENELHIRRRNTQAECPAKTVKPELFNIQMK